MPNEREWADRARRYLKGELRRAGVTYAELARRLNEAGFEGETEASVNSKLARGTFPATFFLASAHALGVRTLRLDEM